MWRRRRQWRRRRRRPKGRTTTTTSSRSDDDGPHPDETADQQRALVESFESEKKLQDDARAREEAHIRRAIELSLQAAQQGTRRTRGGSGTVWPPPLARRGGARRRSCGPLQEQEYTESFQYIELTRTETQQKREEACQEMEKVVQATTRPKCKGQDCGDDIFQAMANRSRTCCSLGLLSKCLNTIVGGCTQKKTSWLSEEEDDCSPRCRAPPWKPVIFHVPGH
ncbi:hypothetical protein QYE76_005698 [Lolium multiflorum]|uniref:Uncharacterized protein n=1 Tax=Lolium multiflorum TaxID=4521 RepID=A0AAD8W3E4_LOLMU|nr:hypothetical protein QYE76_005698 [Lolium multiflorum]